VHGGEPRAGSLPTLVLTPLLSQRAGARGDMVSMRVEGTDAASLMRGKVLSLEREHEGYWQPVGALIATRTQTGSPVGSNREVDLSL
jgi:hypothetical protein